jgi:hypothetical protein
VAPLWEQGRAEIDELHNVLGRCDAGREFLNMRFLGNELRIPLFGVDIRDALDGVLRGCDSFAACRNWLCRMMFDLWPMSCRNVLCRTSYGL